MGRALATEGALANLRYRFEEIELERVISITLPRTWPPRSELEECGTILRGEARWKGYEVAWYAIGAEPGKTKADLC